MSTPLAPQQKPGNSLPDDTLQPFADALRERVPSRDALLAEGKALTRQRHRVRSALGGGLMGISLLAGVWLLDPAWRSDDVEVAIGHRQQLTLADGSVLEVNSGSHLRIEQRWRSRQIELIRGEVLVTVVHDQKPFIVRSQGVSVRDIGTVFDVRSDSRGVTVGVIEGAVEVSNARTAPQRLVAGEALRGSAQTIGPVQATAAETLTAWRQGKLRFNGSPLSEVVADVQHYRSAPISVADARTAKLRLSGEFDSASVESLIGLLPSILPVTVQREADGSVVLKSAR